MLVARASSSARKDTPSELPDADVRDARLAAQETAVSVDEDDVRTVVVPARIGAVIRSLEKAALQGNTNAARELRSWLAE